MSQEDLNALARTRIAEGGKRVASEYAEREARRALKARIPKFLWPLIPGEGGSVGDNVEKMAKRKLSQWLWGVGCSIAFFALFGGIVLFMVAVVLWQFQASGHLF